MNRRMHMGLMRRRADESTKPRPARPGGIEQVICLLALALVSSVLAATAALVWLVLRAASCLRWLALKALRHALRTFSN
jgi:hypothetical protein